MASELMLNGDVCLMISIYVDGISHALSQPLEGMVCIQLTKYLYRDNVEYFMYCQYPILHISIFQLTQLFFNCRTKNIPKIKFFEHMYEFTINRWKKINR
jgi:hypothetical protein